MHLKKNPSLESVLQKDRVSLSCKGVELSLEKSIADNGIVYGDSIDIVLLPEPANEEETSAAVKETEPKEVNEKETEPNEVDSQKDASTTSDSLSRIKSLEEALTMVQRSVILFDRSAIPFNRRSPL